MSFLLQFSFYSSSRTTCRLLLPSDVTVPDGPTAGIGHCVEKHFREKSIAAVTDVNEAERF